MRICFFGESYVNGTGDPTFQGWVSRLCEKARTHGYDITAYNCGIRGATSSLIARSWNAEANVRLTGIDQAALVFSYGTNDCRFTDGAPAVSFKLHMENTRAILRDACARWPTVMIGPPGVPTDPESSIRETDHKARCAETSRICESLRVPYFDTLEIFPTFQHWRREAAAGDGAHPGAGGYAEMAEAIYEWPVWQTLMSGPRE